MDCAYLYFLVGAVNHGDQHVEKNHHHRDVINPVQHVTDVLNELMIILQNHRNHLREPKYGPEQSLEALLNPETHRAQENVIDQMLCFHRFSSNLIKNTMKIMILWTN